MSEKTVDWNGDVQVSGDDGKSWMPVRVLAQDVDGRLPIAVTFLWNGVRRTFVMPPCDVVGVWQFRNTPAQPVPFEFTRWVNVYRANSGEFWEGGSYGSRETAESNRYGSGVTVPVTIRGEWKEESNG